MTQNYNVGVNVVEGKSVSPVAGVTTAVCGLMGNFLKGPINKLSLTTSFSQFTSIYGDKPAPGSTAWYSVKAFFKAVGTGQLWINRVASSTAAKATKTLQDRQGAPANTIKIDAASEGAWGNALSVKVLDHNILTTTLVSNISAGATSATLTAIGGLEVGSDIQFDDTVNQEQVRITSIDAVNKVVNWSGGLTNGYTAAATTVKSLEFKLEVYVDGVLTESFLGLSMNDSVSFFCEKKVVSNLVTVTDLKSTDTDYTDLPAVTATAQALTTGADGLADVAAVDYKGVQASKTGIYAFDSVGDLFRICCPNPILTDAVPATAYEGLVQAILDYADGRKRVQAYVDVPYATSVVNAVVFGNKFEGRRLCLFYPWLKVVESSIDTWLPPSSFVMGAAVRKDNTRGVIKNVGNESLPYAIDVEYAVSIGEHNTLNDAGINVVKVPFVGAGIRTYGGRTKSAETAWRFIHYSEYWHYLASSLERSLQDVPFEVHNRLLWDTVRRRVNVFLANEQSAGNLFDASNPEGQAFAVVMDETNNPSSQVALGIAVVSIEYVPAGTVERFVINLTSSPAGLSAA